MQKTTGIDFEALRRAVEEGDAETLIDLYADDAEVRMINRNSTPSNPFVLRGKEEISAVLRDVCGRDIKHRIESEVVGEERVAFNEACEYPDGTKVLAATTLEVGTGRYRARRASKPGTSKEDHGGRGSQRDYHAGRSVERPQGADVTVLHP